MDNRELKEIPNYPKYMISRCGTLLVSKARYNSWMTKSVTKSKDGYLKTQLTNTVGKYDTFYIHRLVYLTFMGEIKKGCDINHIDGNKENNALYNLEVVTRKENIDHAHKTGLRGNANSRHAWKSRDTILMLNKGGLAHAELSKMFKVAQSTIWRIIHNEGSYE